MDLLYVYDDKIACDRDGNYYTGSAFSQEIFDRYLAQFDTLTLLMRRAPVSPDDMQTLARMNRLTDARIRVVFYPDRRESLRAFLSLQRRREIRQIITRSITPERAVIIRVPSESGTIAARFCRRIGKPFLAEAVGCPCVICSWGFRSREQLEALGAQTIVDTPDELGRVLLGANL